MPFGRCPVCGTGYHLSLNLPVDEWYRQYWPQCQVGDEVPGLCIGCWMELRVGHHIKVRRVSPEFAEQLIVGTKGVVVAVVRAEEPMYIVQFQGQGIQTGLFCRTDLSYALDQETLI